MMHLMMALQLAWVGLQIMKFLLRPGGGRWRAGTLETHLYIAV
uniref:Uncharacterized protein n=1 Tax=Rhizophora mucronata TaxID=61149 RepID=A0A2P2NZS9_RHIMU